MMHLARRGLLTTRLPSTVALGRKTCNGWGSIRLKFRAAHGKSANLDRVQGELLALRAVSDMPGLRNPCLWPRRVPGDGKRKVTCSREKSGSVTAGTSHGGIAMYNKTLRTDV
ncbi:hypothetical protein K461DRAFT_275141 [Myriangium duriaei CBS 260.36]|uniref:Uncharacterized protein n=1 Tax=Myriangium duriaei CBS 260.36 TaxID=1168546 RepID=A0A9P4J620_9PEZI|nr:hypothetical protein K461DRAFT_275141 [Myriangium duriaei CBS 260.36]